MRHWSKRFGSWEESEGPPTAAALPDWCFWPQCKSCGNSLTSKQFKEFKAGEQAKLKKPAKAEKRA